MSLGADRAGRIFRPLVRDGFEWVQPVDEGDFDAIYQLDGSPLTSRWKPIRVRRLTTDQQGASLAAADLPWLGGHALVFRERAFRAVGDVLADAGEFLELDLADKTDRLWLFNVCQVVDALDEEASRIVRFPSSGRVMKIDRHVFHPVRVAGLAAFRVPQVRSLFVSGETVDALTAAQLSGAHFDLVWDGQASVD